MPFTLAHPAIILPLQKSPLRLSLTGLFVGSMVPDFEFFFRLKVTENIGHQWIGFFLIDIPLAIITCFVFHNWMRNTFIDYLPGWYKKRFIQFNIFNWNAYFGKNIVRVLISIVIGILSHFFLDGFTHDDGAFVIMLPVLADKIQLFSYAVPVYSILQILSSLIGLLVLQLAVAAMPPQNIENIVRVNKSIYWISLLSMGGVILFSRILLMADNNTPADILLSVIGSMLYAWIIVAAIFNRKKTFRMQE